LTILTLLHSFSTFSLLPLIPTPRQDIFFPLVLWLENKWHFCFSKIAIQDVSLWYFQVYIYYDPSWSSPL
jgi:hypothetical protein